MAPKLSVAFPTFNRVHWLEGALASILEPGLDCEVIVIDNGSSDGTWAFLQDLQRRDPRVVPERWERNVGIDGYPSAVLGCTGEYLAMFADDDEMLPGGLARKIAFLDSHPEVGLVYTPVRWMDETGQDQGELAWGALADHDLPGDPDFFERLILGNLVPMGSAMFRRSVASDAEIMRNPVYAPSGDWIFWLSLARRTRVAFLREPTARIRLHKAQATTDHGVRAGGFVDANLNIWRHWILEEDPPYVPTPRTWAAILSTYAGMLQATHGANASRVVEGLHRLKAVQIAQEYALGRAAGGGAEEPEAFLCHPDWPSSRWMELVLGYIEAFAPGDPVALILVLDPEGGPLQGEVTRAIGEMVASTGREKFPDVVLLDRPEDLLETLRPYAHVQDVPDDPSAWPDLEGPRGRRFTEAIRYLQAKETA